VASYLLLNQGGHVLLNQGGALLLHEGAPAPTQPAGGRRRIPQKPARLYPPAKRPRVPEPKVVFHRPKGTQILEIPEDWEDDDEIALLLLTEER
jgi:hypothetical protein